MAIPIYIFANSVRGFRFLNTISFISTLFGLDFLSLASKSVLIVMPTLFSLDGFCHKNRNNNSHGHPLMAVEEKKEPKLKCWENFFGLKTTATTVITILAKPQTFPNFSAVAWQVHTIFCWQDVANIAAQR